MFRSTLFAWFALALTLIPAGATDFPTVKKAIPDQWIAIGGTASIDLRDYFEVTGITGQVVQFQVAYGSTTGTFNVELNSTAAPTSVTNFLSYVNSGTYANTLVHRSDQGLGIIQGGGYAVPSLSHVTTSAPIALEYNLPNVRGTMAMARGSAANSATSEWFVNGVDNTTTFGQANNGGYAVFARVTGTGMSVVDAIAALPVYDESSNLGVSALGQMPLSGYSGTGTVLISNSVRVTSASVVPIFPAQAGGASVVSFGGSNSNPSVIGASLSGSILNLAGAPGQAGIATITINATDSNGNTVSSQVKVTAYAGWHFAKLSGIANAFIGGKHTALPSTGYTYFNYYKGTDGNVWALYYGGGKWNQVALSTGGNVDDWFTENTTYNQLYYKGKDGHVYALWYGGGKWNQLALTTTANVAGDLQTDSGTNYTYYRGTDGNIWVLWYGGGKWNQAALTSSANVAGDVAVDSTYHFAYYRGTDSQLWVVWYGAGKWNEAKLSTTANVAGNLVVDPGWGTYYQDSSNVQWVVWFTGTAWAQTNLGVNPGVVSGTSSLYGHLGLVYTGADGAEHYLGNNGSAWAIAPLGPAGLGMSDTPNYKKSEGFIYTRTADGNLGVFYFQ